MKKCTVALMLMVSLSALAQNNSKSKSSSIGIDFSAVPVTKVNGTDTSYQNGFSISPVFDLRNKQGWGISYSPGLLVSPISSGVYMHKITAGFEQYGEKNFDVVLEYSHYFFTNNTAIPYTPINNEIDFSLAYTKAVFKPMFSSSIGFGYNSSQFVHDIGLSAGIGHEFSWDNDHSGVSVSFTPSVLLDGGTNGYFSFLSTSKYISHSKKFIKKVKHLSKKGSSSSNTITTSPFEFDNVELNAETSFEKGAFSLRPSGSIFLPVHSTGSVDGYWEVSMQYHF